MSDKKTASDKKTVGENDRRQILAAGAAALPELALGGLDTSCVRPGRGPNAEYFPNAVLVTHERQRVLFYDDLLAGKIVLVTFMSIAGEARTRVTENLSRVQPYLGDRLGRDVFMYSLTTDPENDSPDALRAFAKRHGARPGWLFLTGAPGDLAELRGRFFHDAGHRGHSHPGEDCSLGLVRYGNEAAGIWGGVPGRAEPEWIARRLDWVTPKKAAAGTPRRRGPVPGAPFPGAIAG